MGTPRTVVRPDPKTMSADHPTTLRRILRGYLAPNRARLAALTALIVAAALLPLAGPQLMGTFVDQAADRQPHGTLIRTASIYLALVAAAHAARLAAGYFTERFAWSSTNQLREDLTEHVLALDLDFHSDHTAGELIERIDGDVFLLSEFLSRFLLEIVTSVLLLIGAVVVVIFEDPRTGAGLTAVLVVAYVLASRFQRAALPLATAEREAKANVLGSIEERLTAAEEIRALGATEHVLYRLEQKHHEAYTTQMRWERVGGAAVAGTRVTFAAGAVAMLAVAIARYRNGAISLGAVLMVFQYSTMVRLPLERMIQEFKEFQRAAAGAARVVALLRLRPAITERPHARALPSNGALDVDLRHVTFAYGDDQPVLHDVTLHLPAGRSLGLVGRTGSGKSTIARLLLRLYEPTGGDLLIGGIDVRDATIDSLRQRVRLVTQDVQLFGATVRDNVTLFDPNIDDDRIVGVLDDLGLAPWYGSLSDGLDTRLGAGAVGVSAGEAQLLAFARVFLADPGLVILDEASSRLDPATELLIDRAIDRLLRDRTAILIAHRLSSLHRVDDIAVLDHGRVVEHGSRDRLARDPRSHFGQLLDVAGVAR